MTMQYEYDDVDYDDHVNEYHGFKVHYGFDEWMLDLIHYNEMQLEDALRLAHICYDDTKEDGIFETLSEYDLDADQI